MNISIENIYYSQEKYMEAISFYKQAVNIYGRALAADYVSTIVSIGNACRSLRKYGAAILLYK